MGKLADDLKKLMADIDSDHNAVNAEIDAIYDAVQSRKGSIADAEFKTFNEHICGCRVYYAYKKTKIAVKGGATRVELVVNIMGIFTIGGLEINSVELADEIHSALLAKLR